MNPLSESLPEPWIREEIARLASSEVLRRAPSHRRLLEYLIDKRLRNDSGALRESAIAFEVFRRDPAIFDARDDPIVRVTIGRLRQRLDAHYAALRPVPRLRIHLPRGSYRLEFALSRRHAETPLGIAVRTTRNVTGDAWLDESCAAFADRLADTLAYAGMPRVIARDSVREAEGRARGALRLARELDARWLVESALTRESRSDLRLSIRLVAGADAAVRWVESAVAPSGDVDGLIDRMLDVALLRLQPASTGTEAGGRGSWQRGAAPPSSVRARLDAIRLLLLRRTVDATDEALALAESLASEYPTYAEAWGWLAAALYSRLAFLDRNIRALASRAHSCAECALSFDPEQAVALRTLAVLTARCDGDADAAEALFRRVLRIAPRYTSARVNYAEMLAWHGRDAETLAQLNLALVYDPLSVTVQLARAFCLGFLHRYDDAREAWKLCRAGGEESVWMLVGEGENELAAGDFATAQALLDKAMRRYPDAPITAMPLALVTAARGDRDAALALERRCVEQFPHTPPALRASVYAMLHERETTLALLQEAERVADPTRATALCRPWFDWLAGDRAFDALRRGIARRESRVPDRFRERQWTRLLAGGVAAPTTAPPSAKANVSDDPARADEGF